MKLDDEDLVRQLHTGSEAAWTELYRRHQARVFRFARRMTGSAALAEEAVQEAFLALLERRVVFDARRGSMNALLIGVARNKVLRQLSAVRGQEPFAAEPAAGADTLFDLAGDIGRMRRAIAALPLHYREPLVLVELEELSYEEAAAILECPVGTVRSRLHRARQMLIERMTPALRAELGKADV